jgi:hypothetical protein
MLSTFAKIIIFLGFSGVTAIQAFAASEGRDNPSETIVWGFLGLCALIILAQIAPMIRNLRKQSKITTEQTKTVKLQQLQ